MIISQLALSFLSAVKDTWKVGAAITAVAAVDLAANAVPPHLPDEATRPPQTYLTADNEIIGRRPGDEYRPLTLHTLPPSFEAVVTAAEDHEFRTQLDGVRGRSLLRAIICPTDIDERLNRRCSADGVSTLEMQVSRGCSRSAPPTARQQIEELSLAVWAANHYSKDEILTLFANCLDAGRGRRGLNRAMVDLFGVTGEAANLGQVSLVVATLTAPNRLDPRTNLTGARKAQRALLSRMRNRRQITQAQMDEALRVRPRRAPATQQSSRWTLDLPEVRAEIAIRPGGRLSIAHTRAVARPAFADGVRRHVRPGEPTAVIVLSPDNEIVTLIGDRDTGTEFNAATMAQRQTGSAAKLAVLVCAVRMGLRADTLIRTDPFPWGDTTVQNHDGRVYPGPLPLDAVTAWSINTAFMRLGSDCGLERLVDITRELGLAAPDDAGPSLVLGAYEQTPMAVAVAYRAALLNCVPETPTALPTDRRSARCRPLLSVEEHRALLATLRAPTVYGTAVNAASGLDAWAKTGTTSDGRDGWVVGGVQTPRGLYTILTWVGRRPVRGRSIASTEAPSRIWRVTADAVLALPQSDETSIDGAG